MRVAIVTESFLPTVNGVTNSVVQVNRELRRLGHEVRIFAPEVPGLLREIEGTTVKPLPAINLRKHLPIALPNLMIDRELAKFQPDVMHLASPALMGAYAQKIAIKRGIPTVAVYQTDFVGFADFYRVSFAKRAIQQFVKATHLNATLNLAPSQFAVEQLQTLGVKRIEKWGRGVDLELFKPKRRNAETFLGFKGKKIIGYVGRLAPEKCVERLSILDAQSDIQLVIIGEGPSRYSLQRQLPNALFTGQLSGENLARHVASLDLFVHAGENETFCQAAQEALACGTPVVAPSKGGVKDFVKPGVNGSIVDMSSDMDLLHEVRKNWAFFTNPETRKEARASVEEKSWSSLTNSLIDYYQQSIFVLRQGFVGVAS
ncbi:MAG: hypothetical protein RLZZ320_629 [Actinomycetota bacterium]|jgi:phosphatidylinositol alpha 1,6-mannosyltransferase